MAEQKAEGSGSFPLHLPTLLVLLTLASGAWLVSQTLTSTRPVALAGKSRGGIGAQTVEARLWEDPFKTLARTSQDNGSSSEGKEPLAMQIKDHHDTCTEGRQGWILPAMLPGGPYSEDQESRIRSRFAIVSALGEQGYVPEEPEHVGSVILPWPTTHGIEIQLKHASDLPSLNELGMWASQTTTQLDLRYEWYRPKNFYPGGREDLQCPYVLVLWLNERDFESEPLVRLPLLLSLLEIPALLEPAAISQRQTAPCDPQTVPCVALIGPWFSSTLRAMLPGWDNGKDPLQKKYLPKDLQCKITKVLQKIDVYSATATAMDAALVKSPDEAKPRASVRNELHKIGFNSFQNFVATDDQLAEEMLSELSLRGVDFTKMHGDSLVNHLVLLSEWDTFYARMLWLTYAAKLAIRLHDTAPQQYPISTLADFIDRYRKQQNNFDCKDASNSPCNLHPFFYLRGLDGQTVGNNSGLARDSVSNDATRAKPHLAGRSPQMAPRCQQVGPRC